MTNPTVSNNAARLLLLAVQGLLNPPEQPATKTDVLEAIRRMGALQIDTIHVVARSPYFVLFSRLGNYDPAWLDALLADGRIFEYWSHAACFLPVEDYPLYSSRMATLTQRHYSSDWMNRHQQMADSILQRIKEEGPVRSSDFERTDGRAGSWWDWKDEKKVLEYLHTSGQLMIARRERFQRVYDLQERVLPGWDAARAVPHDEAVLELTLRSVQKLGLAQPRWAADYFRLPVLGMAKRLEQLADAGLLLRVTVEGWKEPAYLHPENCALLDQAEAGILQASHTTLLSPFDPLTWDRDRARTIFGFDYTIECYLPQEKRRYGYFSLPILRRGALVGRLDAKAHRKDGFFEVKKLYLEPEVTLSEDLAHDVREALLRCAEWHRTPKVVLRHSEPEAFVEMLGFVENINQS
jgi:uncharacterized protein